MSLTLYMHPLASYCHKALIALYENGTPFTPHVVDLMDEAQSTAFKKLWPVGKFPVLRDEATGRVVPESTTIIEYLALNFPGPAKLVPDDPQAALTARAQDRFYDLHVHEHLQKIVGDRLRPAEKKDPVGAEHARSALKVSLGMIDKDMANKSWAAGENFSMADCAAAPALFYVDMAVMPLAGAYDNVAAYLGRLKQRPAYARVLKEAEPYLQYVPR